MIWTAQHGLRGDFIYRYIDIKVRLTVMEYSIRIVIHSEIYMDNTFDLTLSLNYKIIYTKQINA